MLIPEMEAEAGSATAKRVAILYKRNAEPDEQLLVLLEEALKNEGVDVFIDRHLEVGVEWAKQIEEQIREADAVIPLISEAAILSEMLGFEIAHANDVAEATNGRPVILPVRVNYTGPLPDPLAGVLAANLLPPRSRSLRPKSRKRPSPCHRPWNRWGAPYR